MSITIKSAVTAHMFLAVAGTLSVEYLIIFLISAFLLLIRFTTLVYIWFVPTATEDLLENVLCIDYIVVFNIVAYVLWQRRSSFTSAACIFSSALL